MVAALVAIYVCGSYQLYVEVNAQ